MKTTMTTILWSCVSNNATIALICQLASEDIKHHFIIIIMVISYFIPPRFNCHGWIQNGCKPSLVSRASLKAKWKWFSNQSNNFRPRRWTELNSFSLSGGPKVRYCPKEPKFKGKIITERINGSWKRGRNPFKVNVWDDKYGKMFC